MGSFKTVFSRGSENVLVSVRTFQSPTDFSPISFTQNMKSEMPSFAKEQPEVCLNYTDFLPTEVINQFEKKMYEHTHTQTYIHTNIYVSYLSISLLINSSSSMIFD